MEPVNTLINARWIIPVEPGDAVYDHHSLAIKNGRIHAIVPHSEARQRFDAELTLELDQHALIPGLINTHTHAAMSLFRGLADDLPLMDWLNNHIWPAEGTWVGPQFVHEGTQLAIAEMLRGGITCFNDMYFFPDETARAAADAQMRAAVGMILIDFPTSWASHAQEYIEKGLALRDQYKSHPLISTVFAPHAPYTVSDGPLEHMRILADQLNVQIHMHVHETAFEVQQAQQTLGERPLARLEKLGFLTPQLMAVHMTQLTDEEIEACARAGVSVVHCPESNLKLASGFCPVHKLWAAGVNVALGTDGAASNNDLDMFSEMRTAALLAKAVAQEASALPAAAALRMATLNGAKALCIDDETGSLEPGKAADVVAVRLGDIETQPLYHPVSQLVYATGRDKVSDVWIAGRHVLKERALTTLDEGELKEKAAAWQQKIRRFD